MHLCYSVLLSMIIKSAIRNVNIIVVNKWNFGIIRLVIVSDRRRSDNIYDFRALLVFFFFFFHSTTQLLQYVEDSEPVTRSTWQFVNSAKTELQVQKELDKKRFLTSAPHGRGATPYTETVEYQDMIYWGIESLKVSEEVAITIASGRIFQSRTVCR